MKRTFQWMRNGVEGYRMTIEPLTQELLDEFVKPILQIPGTMQVNFHALAEYGKLVQEIALIELDNGRRVFMQVGKAGFVPRVDGELLELRQV